MAKKRPAKKTTKRTTKAAGTRPRVKREQINVAVSRCPKCGSTSRTPYDRKPEIIKHSGRTSDGQPYTRIERRVTKCKDCNQHRFDQTYHNEPSVD